MEMIDREVRRIIFLVLKVSLVPLVGMVMIQNWPGLRGYIIGLSAAILSFILMSRQAWQLTGLGSEEKARKVAMGNFLGRLFFYAVILTLAAKRPSLSLPTTAIGLVMLKFVLVGEGIFKSLRDVLISKIRNI